VTAREKSTAATVVVTTPLDRLVLIIACPRIVGMCCGLLPGSDRFGASSPVERRPADPGGLDVAGESETAYRTSAGQDLDSQLDLGELNTESVTRRAAPTAPQTPEAEDAAPDPVAKPEPAPAPSGASGSVIQLGAYKTQTQAQRGWDALSARFPVLSGLTKMIVPYSGGYRLRAAAASPGAADDACKAVKAGGGNCFVAN
jgi:hypothetical protein